MGVWKFSSQNHFIQIFINTHTQTHLMNVLDMKLHFPLSFLGVKKNAPSAPFYTGAFIDRFFGDCHKVSNQLKYSRSFSMFRSVEFNSRTRKGVSYHFFLAFLLQIKITKFKAESTECEHSVFFTRLMILKTNWLCQHFGISAQKFD